MKKYTEAELIEMSKNELLERFLVLQDENILLIKKVELISDNYQELNRKIYDLNSKLWGV